MFPMLPPELDEAIADAACTMRSNGRWSSNLQIRVKTDARPAACEDEVVQWVLRCLEHAALAHVRGDDAQFPWRVVSSAFNDLDAPDGAGNWPLVVVAVRVGDDFGPYFEHARDEHALVVVDERPERPHMRVGADVLRDVARDVPPPRCVDAVGFSAVSDEFMRALWHDIVARAPRPASLEERGCLVHPMWVRFGSPGDEGAFWSTVSNEVRLADLRWRAM